MKIPKSVKRKVMRETMESLGTTGSSDPVRNAAFHQADKIATKAMRKALQAWVDSPKE